MSKDTILNAFIVAYNEVKQFMTGPALQILGP